MREGLPRNLGLLLLAAVFTGGLTFATVELPGLADEALQKAVPVPGFDSHADTVARLKTELFIAHYHLRTVGYACFATLLLLVIAGFAGKRTGLAAVGGLAFMLPVFAQFAGVMFFLAGLGLLNVMWLPVLDISFELSRLGLVIRAPYELLRWLLGLLRINGYWPLVVFFITAGLLIFFLGTFSWLSARARGRGVADGWIYRLSRHPQYLGWILWSYGVYLLIERGMYPRRSWGISASLPWLLSTLVIIGVALLEELNMERRHPEAYARYRASAPFMLPLPAFLARLFAWPQRLLFGRERPARRREVAAVVASHAAVLVAASVLFYGEGLDSVVARLRSEETRRARAERLANRVRTEPAPRRRWALARELAGTGEVAVGPLTRLLGDDIPEYRKTAAEFMALTRSPRAVPALLSALSDPEGDVRYWSLRSLAVLCDRECAGPVGVLLDDPEIHIRIAAMQLLARIGDPAMAAAALELLASGQAWQRAAAADALGALGTPAVVPVLAARLATDPDPAVRRSVVVALLRTGSPEAREALRVARDDPDREVRIYASEGLKRLGG